MVAVQARRFDGVSGKAEIPGVEDSMRSINSFWRLSRELLLVASSWGSGELPFSDALGILTAGNAGELRDFVKRRMTGSRILGVFHVVRHTRVKVISNVCTKSEVDSTK